MKVPQWLYIYGMDLQFTGTCIAAQGIERSSMGHLRRIACAGRTRYVIGEKMKCRGADQKGCPGASRTLIECTQP